MPFFSKILAKVLVFFSGKRGWIYIEKSVKKDGFCLE